VARPIHFEITAKDPAALARFYQQAFGWQFERWDGPQEYWLISTGHDAPGIDGGLLPRRGAGGTVNTLGVASVDEAVARVEANGGIVAVPKMALPGIGWLAYCVDPQGTMFGLMQEDESAR
jgi:predicted enzyme related to lactoylglutathione lyase